MPLAQRCRALHFCTAGALVRRGGGVGGGRTRSVVPPQPPAITAIRRGGYATAAPLVTDVTSSYLSRRAQFAKEIAALPESRALERLVDFLDAKRDGRRHHGPYDWIVPPPARPDGGVPDDEMSTVQIEAAVVAAMAAFLLHAEGRVAAVLGCGYYTIGPCGEEALSAAAHCLRPQDSLALHYRHGAINLCRQLATAAAAAATTDASTTDALPQILLDRARGYTVSKHDPVTGGVHCSIGSAGQNYIVTSTLASQCPSAVGRALAYALQRCSGDDNVQSRERSISMVTVGDGSVHNHHFWSAFHLARHARHRNVKCPVIFGIADNGLSISYRTGGYVNTLFGNDPLIPHFTVDGNDMTHVYSQTANAVRYARTKSAPAVLLFQNLVRRFGHAATDRQGAYLDAAQIDRMAESTVLESMIVQAVEVLSATTYARVRERLAYLQSSVVAAFAVASREEKVTRADMLQRVSAPAVVTAPPFRVLSAAIHNGGGKLEVMRKHMTRVIAESMQDDPSVVYLGEDVIHGGYYVVTEGLAPQFPGRVLDFPPDETSLLGVAMGFAQAGLIPIVEIPYAKYLDCGADMFHEIAATHWLSAGKRPAGMVIRLQGFDRGVFGGNYHTSNVLSIPPGVDVCCYSNGEDYVMGFRNAIRQAAAGRVVMSVDCTNLLNLRHLHGKDRGWERRYPEKDDGNVLSFDSIRRYGTLGRWAIVTYGNGVVTSLQARRHLVETGALSREVDLDIIDCFYLSSIPDGLRAVIGQYEGAVFADICKEGPGCVLSSTVCSLRSEGLLPDKWELAAAPRTYNPLGSVVTFLNVQDVTKACAKLVTTTSALNHIDSLSS